MLREHLVQRARTFVYTTGTSPAIAGGLLRSIEVCRDAEARRAATLGPARELASGLGAPEPAAAIVPFVVGTNDRALRAARDLADGGLETRAVRPPTVPEGTARLRLCTHVHNTREAVARLVQKLRTIPVENAGGSDQRRGGASDASLRMRSPTLVVAGTDTNVGKTVVSALLMLGAARFGPALYWKPVQTGTESDTETVAGLARATNCETLEPCYSFPLPASPHASAADVGTSIRFPTLDTALRRERARKPEARLIVECAGGLLVPYTFEHTQLDWLAAHRLPLVLVARSGLGTLNHTLLSIEALRTRRLAPEALFLVGDLHPSNRATLEQMSGVRRIYEVPVFTRLEPEALEEWVARNDLGPLFASALRAQDA